MDKDNQSAWPRGGGEMGALIRAYDWESTPLGPICDWPQSLRTAVELMLESGFPCTIQWGRDAICLYNDRARFTHGPMHPAALGRSAFEMHPTARGAWEPVIRRVLNGETVTLADAPYRLVRDEGEQDIWFTHSASPLRDESGKPAGVFVVFFEMSDRNAILRERERTEQRLRETEA